jgi:hypothetical protein
MTDVGRIDKQPKKNRRKARTPLQQADALCGAIVRSRGRCEACGRSDGTLQWAHGFSRSYRKVRHDLRNGFCLCAGCHMRFTHNPIAWEDWMLERMGHAAYYKVRWDALNGPKADLKETIALLQWEHARLGLG